MHIYSISGVRYLGSGTVASFIKLYKEHVSCNHGYRLYIVHARWSKKGGSSEPPRTPPVYGPESYSYFVSIQKSHRVGMSAIIFLIV